MSTTENQHLLDLITLQLNSPRRKADCAACHAAYDVVDENAVYACTGNPHPGDIERVVQSMMSDEFGTSFSRMSHNPSSQ